MRKQSHLVFLAGAITTLQACGYQSPIAQLHSPSDSPPLPPPVVMPQAGTPGYGVLDSRTYFHQHYGTLRVWAQNRSTWYEISKPEQWAGISGYVYSSLNISIDSWWWIPPAGTFAGYVYRWDPGHKRWQQWRSLSGEFPTLVREL